MTMTITFRSQNTRRVFETAFHDAWQDTLPLMLRDTLELHHFTLWALMTCPKHLKALVNASRRATAFDARKRLTRALLHCYLCDIQAQGDSPKPKALARTIQALADTL